VSWKQIALEVPDALKDAVVGELSDSGVIGIWEEIAADPASTRLVAFFSDESNLDQIESRIHDVFERDRRHLPSISRSEVQEHDWNEEWKKSYTSFPIGKDFFIIPSWETSECPPDRLPIRVDPGQAFGTGTHETTQLTVAELERWVESHHVVLDVGTGSGILALASRLLGAKTVIACDIDPDAVRVATSNIDRNNQANILSFCGSVDSVCNGSIDLLLANLTADVIIELFPEFNRVVGKRGLAIFSGILNEHREEIVDACRKFHFKIHEEITRGEWLVVVTEKQMK
jgi:ribosomal protein L11 methyltransferase